MYRTLILLLYGSGLRIGEVLRLSVSDVDLVDRVIIVRDTKFFKTRLVPIGPRLSTELTAHTERRRHLPLPLGENSRMRSEEHTSALQSLMRISYAVFGLKKKN